MLRVYGAMLATWRRTQRWLWVSSLGKHPSKVHSRLAYDGTKHNGSSGEDNSLCRSVDGRGRGAAQ